MAWFSKIKEYFRDFRPEARNMTINYSRKTSTISLALKIDEGFRKNHNKIKIPSYDGFKISSMKDATFHELKSIWRLENNEWILDAKLLPPSDGYFIEMEGDIDEKGIRDLVHIKPALNRDSNVDDDRFWLDSSLKNPKLLETIWTELQINEVDVGVLIDVNKLFGLRLPQDIKEKADTMRNFVAAGKNLDRQAMFHIAQELRDQERKSRFNPNDFIQVMHNLTARTTLIDYLSVEKKYEIGQIDQPTKYQGIVPQDVKVQTITTLTLKEPQSLGYLTFQRKRYLDKIKEEFDDLLKK